MMVRTGFFIFILCFFSQSIFASSTVYQVDGVAIRGYDPVSFHTVKTANLGGPEYSYQWQGVTWYFTNETNKDLFSKSPDNYAPQYGGFCAYAASKGSLAPTDPNAWTIHNDKLYLNYSAAVKNIWLQDIDSHINRADQNWLRLKDKP